MQVVSVPIDSVIPYEKNPRKITQQAIDQVAASIEEVGFRQPIVVNKEMVVIVGHTRLLASKKLGLKEVPVHIAELTKEQEDRYRVRDNKSGEFSKWDFEVLEENFEIPELIDIGFGSREIYSEKIEEKQVKEDIQYQLLISCTSEKDQELKFNKLKEMGIECQVLAL